ncbi:hypothetical protein SAMN06265365_10299 [Tistlia consotensis]|uniref:Uncharacterized protein n=1 Tax=Tistlia consotensis USBA 355 TaxID=560819 RepID=A0A1Y6BL78_9PROT|nr:hypothetical protein [Tistlia consotensis]SMF09254.1 hypothetical protein SAMN05428998_104217 [Tistlia consotensis USBA 355]SNR34724.1 hypothetical protein SAMN06265365_10299 [Tistlia consotensis]
MSRALDFDPFVHPPLQAGQRAQLRAEGKMGPADRELTFGEFLDAINPLQHIPIVGSIYRAITGDTMDSTASVVGSMIYGGPVGMVAGLVDAVVQQASGHDIGGLALAMVSGEDITAPVAATASAATAAAEQAASAAATGADAAVATAAQTAAVAGAVTADAAQPATSRAAAAATPPAAEPAAMAGAAAMAGPAAVAEPTAATGDGKVLEGKDALAALAADLRAAASGRPTASTAAAPLRASAAAQQAAASEVPPPGSFMPLKQRDFGGPELATKLNPAHAAGESRLGQDTVRSKGLFPASLSVAAERAPAAAAEPAASGAPAAPGLQADQRFAGEIAPRTNFTDRMMEALNKYQALSRQNEGAGAVN